MKRGMYSGLLAFIGILPFSLDHCEVYTNANAYSARDMLYIQSMKNMRLSFYVLSACPSEEETSAAAAKRLCTLPKKCSVRERAGISPVFCAVSIKGSKVICISLFFFVLGIIYHQNRNGIMLTFLFRELSPYLDLENRQRLQSSLYGRGRYTYCPIPSSIQTNIELCTYWYCWFPP